MKLHMLSIPHTRTTDEFSHCAFTGKVKRFAPMMRPLGYEVIHYGNGGADSGASEDVDLLSQEEYEKFVGKYDPKSKKFVGDEANVNTPLYQEFNSRLGEILKKRVNKGDIICFPFGVAHRQAVKDLSTGFWVETGIGYPECWLNFRVYESYSQLARIHGSELVKNSPVFGSNYHWVIPNYYDLKDWNIRSKKGSYVLYFGRITEIKGLGTVVELAKKRPDLDFVLVGQGDPEPYLKSSSNIHYVGVAHGKERSALFENAIATLCPSKYMEPFCGVAVESMLCGTPVLTVDYGAFVETVQHGITGFRCKTLGDWQEGLRRIETWGIQEWTQIAEYARQKYDMHVLAHQYDKAFRQISELGGKGWYSDTYFI